MNKLRQAHVALQGDLNALLPALQQPVKYHGTGSNTARSCVMNIPGVTDHPGDSYLRAVVVKTTVGS